ncbi:hypothetical protein B0H34DRAFT_727690 [Crassisporium funariophilum]|nr:hypothetical protein B0H34DRAFT_727690 [Crassisporium funariophilum]
MGMGMAIGILGRGRARWTRFGWRERTSAEGLGNGKRGREGIRRSIGRTGHLGGYSITGQSTKYMSICVQHFLSSPIAHYRLSGSGFLPPLSLPSGPSSSPTLPLASNPSLASAPSPHTATATPSRSSPATRGVWQIRFLVLYVGGKAGNVRCW